MKEAGMRGIRKCLMLVTTAMLVMTAFATVTTIGGFAVVPSAASADRTKFCATTYYRYRERGTSQYVEASNIRVQSLSCVRARRLARDYAHAYRINYGTPRHLDGFTCRWIRLGDDVGIARCRAASSFTSFSIYDSSPYH
jgi:hypothetical protein